MNLLVNPKNILLTVLIHSLFMCVTSTKNATVIDKGDHYLVCRGALDLGIIFDVSQSIWIRHFDTVKHSLVSFLKQFTISPKGVRVGLIPFENEIHPDAGFTLDKYNNSADVLEHINQLPHIGNTLNRNPALTETRKALKYTRETLLSSAARRKRIPSVCLVMTDGTSQNRSGTAYEAKALRDTGVTVYAVGFGRGISMQELDNIAGDRSRVKLARNFGDLDKTMSDVSVDVCEKIPKPQDPPCTDRDFQFVFSRAELGDTLSGKAVDLVEAMAQSKEFGAGYRFGVTSGVCPKDAGFGLTSDVTNDLQHYRNHHFTDIVTSMKTKSPFAGSPNEARCNVWVLVVNEVGLKNLQANVDTLRRNGAEEVFVWNVSGRVVTVRDAIVIGIAGHDPLKAAAAITRELTTE